MPNPPKLLDLVREKLRVKHYAIRTEQTYVDWIRRFILFHDKRHPKDLGAPEVEAFLTHLAVAGKVAASTQNQAKSALLFLYREVLDMELPWLDKVTQAKAPKRLPVVLTVGETRAVLAQLTGAHALIAGLLYGAGMRLMEVMRLRVKDIDFARHEILVREGKGGKDRVTMLPETLVVALKLHLAKVKALPADAQDADLHVHRLSVPGCRSTCC
jgi:integrase